MFDILKYPNRRKTITAYIVFGAISLVFVFMGMETGNNSMGGHAAIVNDTIISPKEYDMAYNNLSRFYGNMFGGNNQMGGQNFIRQMAMNQLVNQTVVNEYSSELGVHVTADELTNYIINIPAFQENNRFKKDFYFNYLKSQGITSFTFENQLKREIGFNKVRQVFTNALMPSQKELGKEKQLMSMLREASLLKWNKRSITESKPVTNGQIAKWLGSEQNQSSATEKYEETKAAYATEEQVKARHILLKTDAKSDDEKKVIKAKMTELIKTLTPENFSEVAKKETEDMGSKTTGGSLGFFGKGQMVPEFEKVAFALKPGEISSIVESNFGFHVILVEEKKPAGQKTFEEVKNQVARELIVDEKVTAFEDEIKKALGSKSDLNRFVRKYNLKWEKTGEVAATADSIKGAGRSPEAMEALFSLKDKGEVSGVIESASSSMLIRLDAMKTKKDKLEDTAIRQRLLGKYSQNVMGEWTKSLESRADIKRNERLVER